MSSHPESSSRLLQESLISLAQAGRRFPRTRPGRSPNPTPSAIWRWVREGVRAADGRRIQLEAILVAGRWLTSLEAIERFVMAQQPATATGEPASPDLPTPLSPAARRRAAEKAGLELERQGK